jgi:hypothetical protein
MSQASVDPMSEFADEHAPAAAPAGPVPPAPRANRVGQAMAALAVHAVRASGRGRWLVGLAVAGMLALAPTPFVALWALQDRGAEPAPMGTLMIDTEPAGIEVRVDGAMMGTSPLRVPVPAGRRTLALTYEGTTRSVTLFVSPGEVLRQSTAFVRAAALPVEAPPPAPPAKPAPAPRPAPAKAQYGFLHVDVSMPMRIFEDGRLVGTTDMDQVMLPVGEHVLELKNDDLQFSTRQSVKVTGGETATMAIRVPSAPVSINARPWADAWVDGTRIGETPIGNVTLPIGKHEVVLKHPSLGERRRTVLVTMGQPARVSVDFKAEK